MRIVTAWTKSETYTEQYPQKLAEGLSKFDYTLDVITEDRWPVWWCKMGVFDPKVKGDLLYMDLDTIVVGSLGAFMRHGRSMMLRDFYQPLRAASGVMILTETDRAKVWDVWMRDPEAHMARHKRLGDGAFIASVLRPSRFLQDAFPGRIASFKVDCQTFRPDSASLICYHGNPRPHVTDWATEYCSDFPHTPPPANAPKCGVVS
jgi:hypothetical protein